MVVAILLSVAASFCTATSSVCQRLGARHLAAGSHDVSETAARGFDAWLVFRLARQPTWLAGFAFMIVGFIFQAAALHFGPLALVQPILAVELVIVFGYLGFLTRCRGVRWREWLAAIAMAAGIGVFLGAASPSGGRPHAPGPSWLLAGLAVLAVVAALVAAARVPPASTVRGPARGATSQTRRTAFLGVATGVGWGFVSAVIKELTSHLDGGPGAIFANWSVYVLIGAGAATMVLASHAMAAGPLAASQPGFTICDPVVAILLGVFLFGEHLRATPAALAAQVLGLIILAAGVSALSRSGLITDGHAVSPGRRPDRADSELARKSGTC
jgi:drug/metabolite transporter (DMT)-like permease